MQYGFVIPTGDIHTVGDLAVEAEAAGWDGVFTWDGMDIGGGTFPIYDPWIVLAAIALRTERVRIGAIVTPPSRRRPWKLARETMTLDHLSHGRLVLPVGLGAIDDGGFAKVGEATDRKTRAELLDESLAILTGLWSGKPFGFAGEHYRIAEMTFLPPPVQTPRIPIWVVAAWPRPKSLARALRYDGVLPSKLNPDGSFAGMTAVDLRDLTAYVAAHRTEESPFEIVLEGTTPGDDPAAAVAIVGPLAAAGATWWIESRWEPPNAPDDLLRRIRQGPPPT